MKDRLWIPHQFALEYHRRRLDVVIASQVANCEETRKDLQETLRAFRSPRSHALIAIEHLKAIESICDALKKSADDHEVLLADDTYLAIISELFEGRVGTAPTSDALKALHTEADIRFKSNIPPGYLDARSKTGSDAHGDYIGWAQILEHAKASSKDVILVTDDRKEDWWIKPLRGKSMGPRPQLLEEFRRSTGRLFHMYTPDRFMEFAGQRLQIPIDPLALQEAREQASQAVELEKGASPVESSIHAPKAHDIAVGDELLADDKTEVSASTLEKSVPPDTKLGEP